MGKMDKEAVSKEKRKKILVVDDEPDVVTYLAAFFRDNGFEVITALNGREGFDMAQVENPDLISLDITMPHETGIKLLGDLQENAKTSQIPVIIVTGTPGKFEQLCAGNGRIKAPAGYFEKPVDRDQLLDKIKRILKDMVKN